MIIDSTPSRIRLQVGQKTVTIHGEAAGLGVSGKPYFVVYSNSIKHWDPPHESDVISEESKNSILQTLLKDSKESNFPVEIE